jgi:shikimate kinase
MIFNVSGITNTSFDLVSSLFASLCQMPAFASLAKQAKACLEIMNKNSTSRDVEAALETTGLLPIVLVGLMGAGKTSIGRRLAEKMDLPFVDADVEIEKAAGKSIPDIFADHGEAHFRDGERRVIARLLENGKQVLATGGGAFMNEDTRAAIKAHSISVWLKADLEVLLKRVAKRGGRPLLENRDPAEVLQNLIDQRYPVYAEADITVESLDVQHNQMVNAVLEALAQWQPAKELNAND